MKKYYDKHFLSTLTKEQLIERMQEDATRLTEAIGDVSLMLWNSTEREAGLKQQIADLTKERDLFNQKRERGNQNYKGGGDE